MNENRLCCTKLQQVFLKNWMHYNNKVTWGYGSEKNVAGFQWDYSMLFTACGKHLLIKIRNCPVKIYALFSTLIKTFCVDPAPGCHTLCKTHCVIWQKINHWALKCAVVAVFIIETLHTAYKSIYNVYSTWMPALLNINTICVHIISMLIRSIYYWYSVLSQYHNANQTNGAKGR